MLWSESPEYPSGMFRTLHLPRLNHIELFSLDGKAFTSTFRIFLYPHLPRWGRWMDSTLLGKDCLTQVVSLTVIHTPWHRVLRPAHPAYNPQTGVNRVGLPRRLTRSKRISFCFFQSELGNAGITELPSYQQIKVRISYVIPKEQRGQFVGARLNCKGCQSAWESICHLCISVPHASDGTS